MRLSPSTSSHPRSASVSIVRSCSKTDAASTTVTRLARLAASFSLTPVAASVKVKVSATGIGSEMPEDSISTWSNRSSAASEESDSSRSSRSVQQMQPLDSWRAERSKEGVRSKRGGDTANKAVAGSAVRWATLHLDHLLLLLQHSTLTHERRVDVDRSHIIDDHGYSVSLAVIEHVIEEGRCGRREAGGGGQ